MLKIACLDAIQALFGGLGYIQISIVLPQQNTVLPNRGGLVKMNLDSFGSISIRAKAAELSFQNASGARRRANAGHSVTYATQWQHHTNEQSASLYQALASIGW